jgi:hypothetical protein
MQNEKETAPTFPKESLELWGKIRAASEKPDPKKLKDLLAEAELPPKMVSVFPVAVAEEKELLAIIEAPAPGGQGSQEMLAGLTWIAANAKPTTLEEAQKLAAERVRLTAELSAAQTHSAQVQQAQRYLAWLRGFFSELFGLPLPQGKGALSMLMPSPKAGEVLYTAGVVDLWRVAAWRDGGGKPEETLAEKRRKVFSSFNPIPADKSKR